VISFRYHLVSIIAVFLALALGIVVGTTLLNGPVTRGLRDDVNSLKHQRSDLNDQVKQLNAQVKDAGEFATSYGEQLVANRLAEVNVLLVSLPGADTTDEEALAQEIKTAGGTVTGRVRLTDDYVNERQSSGIRTLATGDARPIALTLPETDDAGALGARLLAWTLTGHGQQSDVTQVLAGFTQLHMLTTDGNAITPTTTVVVIAKGSLARNAYAGGVERSLVSEFRKWGKAVVVAGDEGSANSGGIIAVVRGSDLSSEVATVDNAFTPEGQVSTVLTLAGAEAGAVGHYGTQASDMFPPVPAK
jgi:hypothetical protein